MHGKPGFFRSDHLRMTVLRRLLHRKKKKHLITGTSVGETLGYVFSINVL